MTAIEPSAMDSITSYEAASGSTGPNGLEPVPQSDIYTLPATSVPEVEQTNNEKPQQIQEELPCPPESNLIDEIEDLFLANCSQEDLVFDIVEEPEVEEVSEYRAGEYQSSLLPRASKGSCAPGQPFPLIIRNLIEGLLLWGPNCEGGPGTGSFLALLCEVESELDRIINIYLQAIPRPVQALFERVHWSFDDLVSLPDAKPVKRRGVYLHIFQRHYRGQLRDMGYVGYSQCLEDRADTHEEIIKEAKLKGRLPGLHVHSRHYQHALHANHTSCYRILATFDDSLETKYLIFMESLFMILFRTVRYPGYATWFNPRSLYDSLYDFSRLSGIVSPLFGLNMALSVYQGMPHSWSHLDLPCVSCEDMTYPSHHLPKGENTLRRPFDSKDPSRGYLCSICRHFRMAHQRLPTPEEIEMSRVRVAHLETGASHASCQACGDTFLEIITESDGYIHRRYVYGKWCCNPCYKFFNDKGRFPSPEELEGRRRRREAPAVTSCEVCNCTLQDARYKRYKAGKWCCDACGNFFRDHGRFKTAEEIESKRIQRAMRSTPACQGCRIPFAELNGPQYNVENRRCCIQCYNFHRGKKRFRNEKEIEKRLRLHAKKRARNS